MHFVLVSACLLGSPVRYDGAHRRSGSKVLQRWLNEGRVVPVCPELAGGLPVPRPPAEVLAGAGGAKVLAGLAKVVDPSANDISAAFVTGAHHALQLAQSRRIRVAVLQEGSPSCGSGYIYDGTFTGTKVPERGVTSALLERTGVRVFSEEQFVEAHEFLLELEARDAA
ncbi:DUF523 domain-containing protein [Paucibacter sediminis]|uniref:DUF523 domain-containing protein n=1 Tax=Paucibacter sediminis TaxID=3019553 RepID=A0AA95NIM2_9BURK|nr:DUF523 domain-containing protein [Paucibacter sp. S2-9]WIT14278.1 DUF523 domain-containing protein [Paucibacter sp. S2-9]